MARHSVQLLQQALQRGTALDEGKADTHVSQKHGQGKADTHVSQKHGCPDFYKLLSRLFAQAFRLPSNEFLEFAVSASAP
jgi:hypothetical protein